MLVVSVVFCIWQIWTLQGFALVNRRLRVAATGEPVTFVPLAKGNRYHLFLVRAMSSLFVCCVPLSVPCP